MFGCMGWFVYLCIVNRRQMTKKRYPEIDEEDGMLPDDYDPGIGPYTINELNARIDEAEIYIAQAEKGDYRNWVTSAEMDAELYKEFPWLR